MFASHKAALLFAFLVLLSLFSHAFDEQNVIGVYNTKGLAQPVFYRNADPTQDVVIDINFINHGSRALVNVFYELEKLENGVWVPIPTRDWVKVTETVGGTGPSALPPSPSKRTLPSACFPDLGKVYYISLKGGTANPAPQNPPTCGFGYPYVLDGSVYHSINLGPVDVLPPGTHTYRVTITSSFSPFLLNEPWDDSVIVNIVVVDSGTTIPELPLPLVLFVVLAVVFIARRK